MYKLYWHPDGSSLAPMAVLEETGVPYDLHQVDFDGGENTTAAHLTVQPLGLVPALGFEDGSSMFESAAIVQYLSDRHRVTGLAPDVDEPARASYLQWLYFLTDTIYPTYNRMYHPERFTTISDGADGVQEQCLITVLKQWRVIENQLASSGPFLLGERFSSADIYLQMLTTWHPDVKGLLSEHRSIRDLAIRVFEREACRRAIDRHNFDSGF